MRERSLPCEGPVLARVVGREEEAVAVSERVRLEGGRMGDGRERLKEAGSGLFPKNAFKLRMCTPQGWSNTRRT